MFVIIEVILGAAVLHGTISYMVKTISSLKSNENAAMLLYNEMLKSGNKINIQSMWQGQMLFLIVVFEFFDIFLAKIFKTLTSSELPKMEVTRNMTDFSGFSAAVAIVAVLLVGYTVVTVMKKKESNRMLLSITKTEYNK